MKHIKTVNEFYHRTAGFKYSEPSLRFSISSYYIGKASVEDVSKVLSGIGQVKFENVVVQEDKKSVKVQVESGVQDVTVDGFIGFDILVYNEREVDKIIEDFSKSLYIDYGVGIADCTTKEHGEKK